MCLPASRPKFGTTGELPPVVATTFGVEFAQSVEKMSKYTVRYCTQKKPMVDGQALKSFSHVGVSKVLCWMIWRFSPSPCFPQPRKKRVGSIFLGRGRRLLRAIGGGRRRMESEGGTGGSRGGSDNRRRPSSSFYGCNFPRLLRSLLFPALKNCLH